MKALQVEVTLLSPLQLGSGKADVILDSEAVHDRYGLPYFPGKRFKGLLYESALELAEMSNGAWFTQDEVDALFGHGSSDTVAMRIDNLTLNDYEKKQEQWKYLQTSFPELLDKDALWESSPLSVIRRRLTKTVLRMKAVCIICVLWMPALSLQVASACCRMCPRHRKS